MPLKKRRKTSRVLGACEQRLIFGEFFKKSPLLGDLSLPYGEFRESDSIFVNLKSGPMMGQNLRSVAGLEHTKCC
jgi:hypothetical protein